MFASFPRTRGQRRGVVLIVILGMLGLLALVGVTFATFSGQERINARNYSQSQNWPDASEMMDYALSQLIDDTDNPMSAIRGHSLKRDMYGNDGLYNAALTANPSTGLPFMITAAAPVTAANTFNPNVLTNIDGSLIPAGSVLLTGLIKCQTNILVGDRTLYGYNFTRWIMRFPTSTVAANGGVSTYVGETHEVLIDDPNDASGFRAFYIAPYDGSYATPSGLDTTLNHQPTVLETPTSYSQAPTIPYPQPWDSSGLPVAPGATPAGAPVPFYSSPETGTPNPLATTPIPTASTLIGLPIGTAFTLDGRYLHAFNGPGMAGLDAYFGQLSPPFNQTLPSMGQYANFRVNGNILNGKFTSPALTTPYATTAAYGNPNSICGMDEDYDACDLENWFLALQSGDGQVMIPSFHRPGILIFDPTVNDPVTGAAPFDDWKSQNVFSASKILRPRAADGHNALTFPDLKPGTNGQITYDVDNDGDGVTDSVWLDLGYPPKRNTEGQLYKPLFAFMVIGLNGRIPLNTAGNLQLRDITGSPYYAHASGKGYSPSEIDPTYALQNGFGPGYSPLDNAGVAAGGVYNGGTNYAAGDGTNNTATYPYAPWWGSAGMPVSLVQLRNLLAGTRTQSVTTVNGQPVPSNHDANFVMVNWNKWYMPNGVMDAGDAITTPPGTVATATAPVPGRWGEANDVPTNLFGGATASATIPPPGWPPVSPTYLYHNPVRAGVSGQWNWYNSPPIPLYGDARDDNHNTFDWYPANPSGTGPMNALGALVTTLGESYDCFDASGSLSLPVERIRRFVTPIDVAGDGLVNNFETPLLNNATGAGASTLLLGGDDTGRVAYVKHFRPPGLALATPPGILLPATIPANPPSGNAVWYPYHNVYSPGTTASSESDWPDSTVNSYNWLKSIGNPPPLTPSTRMAEDRTTNLYHGYEWFRNPSSPSTGLSGLAASVTQPQLQYLLAAAQYDNGWAAAPTFDQFVNSDLTSPFQPSANLNEADEMSLYNPSPFDAPFGPGDLEWLYRQQDTDGASLASRLKELAPISFTNPLDGLRRRRLFSLDTWEPTNFVWANDTPTNDPQLPTYLGNSTGYVANSRFLPAQSASAVTYAVNKGYNQPVPLPSIAHRDRKINLNFPLPVSNRYDEPVRQKWIRETYQLLKMILPPSAVDTPEELAQLSQFVVNIIDFRDPDSTCTRFVNTDVYYATKATTTAPATLLASSLASYQTCPATLVGTTPPTLTGNLASVATTPPPAFSPMYDNANSPYLVQYGMEYNPVAITEILAYQFKGTSGQNNQRVFVELVNTLSEPTGQTTAITGDTNTTYRRNTACDLEMEGWDFIILPDNPTGRPDPYTGQIPYGATSPIKGITLSGQPLPTTGAASAVDTGGLLADTSTAGGTTPGDPLPLLPLTQKGTPRPYIFQSKILTGTGDETSGGSPDFTGGKQLKPVGGQGTSADSSRTIDLVTNSPLPSDANGGTSNAYYWLYLRRPANPFDLTYDWQRPNENRVVVDCFRFVLTTTTGSTDGELFSTARLQPFRGGHAVPPPPPAGGYTYPNKYSISAYGYSDQITVPTAAGPPSWKGNLSSGTTGAIYHSLGKVSTVARGRTKGAGGARGGGGAGASDDWDFFPFHDRDFTSVAELLLVPGCPPGLFTKQFIEFAPPIQGAKPQPSTFAKGVYTGPNAKNFREPDDQAPPTFPYLMDEFFYTAQAEPASFLASKTTSPTLAPGVVWPDPGTGPAPIRADANFAAAPTGGVYASFPLTTPNPTGTGPTYYAGPPTPTYVGGPSGAGWYKMFEFFEVPSPANGAIAPVRLGSNYDWARQDLRPGMLNLNLIIDEEVFFGVMSESWLKTLGYVGNYGTSPSFAPSQQDVDNMGDTRLNVAQVPSGGATPQVVTQINFNRSPRTSYSMKNQGFMALDPYASGSNPSLLPTGVTPVFDNRMKQAFSDFLKLRHGGSGFMFAYGNGNVGDPNTTLGTTLVASERPFRSFSYPDVNYTLMRPAALPPSTSTLMTPWGPAFDDWDNRTFTNSPTPPWLPALATGVKPPFKVYIGDPGVKNPYLFTENNPPQPPPIPARRLFQVPDTWGFLNYKYVQTGGAPTIIQNNPTGFPTGSDIPNEPDAVDPSNASSAESTYPPATWTTNAPATWLTFTGDPNVNWQNLVPALAGPTWQNTVPWVGNWQTLVAQAGNPDADLSAYPTGIPVALTSALPAAVGSQGTYAIVPNHYLGGNTNTNPAGGGDDLIDNRQHPAFRYEWLQKVTNLTTVRTHQYAVWITVGFFEVTQQGDPSIGAYVPGQAYDRLGRELNIQSGRNIRYRGFFLIDRTRAVGFSPQAPGNFRDCITYRQLIE
jgi:hypothetical protein